MERLNKAKLKAGPLFQIVALWTGVVLNVDAATFYVDANGTNATLPYAGWSTAATNIQDAVDAATNGDLVLVTNGVYQTGGRAVYGTETNRVALTNGITLLSVNGPGAATIVGGTQTRCVYVRTSALLSGFTLTGGNGSSAPGSDATNEQSGGGAWCAVGGVISNCYIVANSIMVGSSQTCLGGGVFGGVVFNSTLTNNIGHGAAAITTLYNCTVTSNLFGGGMSYGTASNCFFVRNRGNDAIASGVEYSTVYSSTFLGDSVGTDVATFNSSLYNCLVLTNTAGATQCILSNCIVGGNTQVGTLNCTNYNCSILGNKHGGVNGGISYNCIISGNTNSANGGGVFGGVCYNCVITGNGSANSGGGASGAKLWNCTVVSNYSATIFGGGGGVSSGYASNCIVYYNTGRASGELVNSTFAYCCTTPNASGLDSTSFTNPPVFVNLAGGDYHLQSNSPCINSGKNSIASGTTDLDGNPRIVGGTVDMGAYEYQTPVSAISYAWLQQYGLPIVAGIDTTDSDGTGMNNWQKWIAGLNPTNPASVLVMTSAASTNNASGIKVSWQSVNTRTYYLLRGSNLTAQPPFAAIQSNIVGQAGTTSYQDITATNSGPYFYRVGVQ